MSFGKNPHVAKATLAEQKARSATHESSRVSAWREAARLWERAAERESFEKRIAEYTRNAEAARAEADGTGESGKATEPARSVTPQILN